MSLIHLEKWWHVWPIVVKLHLAWVLVDRVHCTFGNCAKVREKTFDPGVAEEKRSAWVRSFDSDALLRYWVPVQCQYSATECHGCSAERWNSAIRCDPYMFLTYFTVTLRTTDKTDIISWRASAGIKRKWQFGSSHSRTQVACFRNSNLVCRYIDISFQII